MMKKVLLAELSCNCLKIKISPAGNSNHQLWNSKPCTYYIDFNYKLVAFFKLLKQVIRYCLLSRYEVC